MNWFANVSKYLWSAETTPYFIAPDAMSRRQARNEALIYAVLLGSIFAVVAVGGGIAMVRQPDPAPALWALFGLLVLWACYRLIRLRGRAAAWVVALAPAALLPQIVLSGLDRGGIGPDQILMTGFVLLLLRYGWRIVRIVRCHGETTKKQ
jgi:hypothetical protein